MQPWIPKSNGAGMTGQRVLVVDDDPSLREILHTALTDEGYEAQTATDGNHALATLRIWRPDLIVLDLMMPGMSGWSFRRALLADASLASIPVVVVTAAYKPWVEEEQLEVAAVMA